MNRPHGHLLKAEEKARAYITQAEDRYSRRKDKQSADSHLWEHSRLVASLARRLAEAEGRDASGAYLAGLFHDAGKFAGGRYHAGGRPEEQSSRAAAGKILEESGFGPPVIQRVKRALDALYQAGRKRDALADIVHDADFLVKSGRLGIAQFFIKSTLRGLSLSRILTESLSRELTYAAVLNLNMRTAAGRKMAGAKAAEMRRYFLGLLRELEEAHGTRFTLRRLWIDLPPSSSHLESSVVQRVPSRSRITPSRRTGRPRRFVPVVLVHARCCDRCGGPWRLDLSTERGVKCERLEVRLDCSSCGREHRSSFCLPEISGRGWELR